MTDRAVSTVVDVSMCLLLVGAAVLTLLAAPTAGPDPADGRAEEVATTLAGSTATVSYEHGGENRTAHGTHAGLLADAAVDDATPNSDRQFRVAVASATRPALGGPGWRGQVVASWRPHEASDRGSAVRIGPAAPSDADVHAATMEVPSGLSPVRRDARIAADRDGYSGVAAVLAGVHPGIGGEPAGEARLATELEGSYDSPAAAARAVSVGRVSITVRTWSP